MNIWRLTISTGAEEGVDPREFCVVRKMMGVGWAVDPDGPLTWEEYEALGRQKYHEQGDKGWWPALNAIHNRAEKGDLCWTRDWHGRYFLGLVGEPWEYRADAHHRRADVVNVRPCTWVEAGTVDAVPGRVVNSFRASRTLQQVTGTPVREYSKVLYNELTGEKIFEVSDPPTDILSFLLPEDVEDIVALMLQEEGHRLIPSSSTGRTMRYEFVLFERLTGKKTVVQVKTGNEPLRPDEYADLADQVVLFTVDGNYPGPQRENVRCLDRGSVTEFVWDQLPIMPQRVKAWVGRLKDQA